MERLRIRLPEGPGHHEAVLPAERERTTDTASRHGWARPVRQIADS